MSTQSENLSPTGAHAGNPDDPEIIAIKACNVSMESLRAQHPDWYEQMDDVAVDSAPRADIVELLHSAPNEFARGFIYGKFTMRMELAAVTGRPFE